MNFFESLKMALDSIRSNKMRSFLTMLGIIIGISSVITIVSLGQGGQKSITGQLESLGSATVNLKVDSQNAQQSDYITFKDIEAIKNDVDTVKYVTPNVQQQGIATTPLSTKRAMITGTNSDASNINSFDFLDGRYFNDNEYLDGKAVVIIDENSAKALFGDTDVVGKTFSMGQKGQTKKVTIVGVTKASGIFGSFKGSNMPAFIYTPATFLQTIYSQNFNLDSITIMATSKDNSEDAGNSAVSVLESRHNNRGKNLYTPSSALSQINQINNVLGIFTGFIGAVAAISLLVGGIGVMNIMLVSVTERTREIGIRKSIGANTNVILIQFLTESVILSLIGGIIGMTVGIVASELIGMIVNVTPSISLTVVLGAILFSSAVGIVFGVYPAKQAAKLDPIEALRYE